jgi:hypothetical protein
MHQRYATATHAYRAGLKTNGSFAAMIELLVLLRRDLAIAREARRARNFDHEFSIIRRAGFALIRVVNVLAGEAAAPGSERLRRWLEAVLIGVTSLPRAVDPEERYGWLLRQLAALHDGWSETDRRLRGVNATAAARADHAQPR